ncbi:Chromosome partition protein Smc [Carpediemonas membranifera]|uniref:Chromosome partition protein Smc n=1 Tax=Carpediemonas membranifera TaxID=201153 RepID=A0A8J6B034_9EUKA|nr:Chromosome partition protein Smc [Carpediemonas membranifera]|eukprot:KAG9395550.1 Chromosome partition protein Smc [Carpediemonas membranifera]
MLQIVDPDILAKYERVKTAITRESRHKKKHSAGKDFSCQVMTVDDSWDFLEGVIPISVASSKTSSSLKHYIVDKMAELKTKDAELSQYKRHAIRYEREIEQLRIEAGNTQQQLADANARVASMERQAAEMEADKRTLKDIRMSEQNKALELEEALRAVHVLLREKEAAINQARKAETDAREAISSLQERIALLKGDQAAAVERARVTGAKDARTEADREAARLKEELKAVQDELSVQEERHQAELAKSREAIEDTRERCDRKIAGLQDRLALQQLRIGRLRAALGVEEEPTPEPMDPRLALGGESPDPSPATPPRPVLDVISSEKRRKKGKKKVVR